MGAMKAIYSFLLGCPLPRRKCLIALSPFKIHLYRPVIFYIIFMFLCINNEFFSKAVHDAGAVLMENIEV